MPCFIKRLSVCPKNNAKTKKGVDKAESEDYHNRNDPASAKGRVFDDDDDAGGFLLF